MDGISDLTLRRQLSALYDDIEAPLPTPQLLYKDYCLSLEGLNGSAGLAASAEYQASRAFWWQRVRELPPPPQLPLAAADGEAPRATGRFDHLGGVLSAAQLCQLRANCAAAGVTPTAVMLTIYSAVLSRFARRGDFMLNILHCLRHPVHPDVTSVIGNFSSSFLLAADVRAPVGFVDLVRTMTAELTADLEHTTISGVEVMEEYNRVHGSSGGAVAPFVFVSAMGLEHALTDWRQLNFTETYVEEATPGSWVVNAVKEYPDGRLMWLLEVQRGLFPEEVVKGLVASYERLLHTLCAEPSSWRARVAELLPDCLLYTSPSPRDGLLSRMPSSA